MSTFLNSERACLAAFEAAGHEAKLNDRGEPDEFALELDWDDDIPHNGFQCVRCLEAVCVPCFSRGHGLGVPIEPCVEPSDD